MVVTRSEEEKLYYTQTGDVNSPHTLMFIHGATMTGAGLAPIADCFKEYNCITVDLPGHGQSLGETKHRVEDFADSMEFLINKLHEDHIISDDLTCLGFSMGGCITAQLAIKKLPLLKRIVIMSSGVSLKGNTPLIKEIENNGVEKFESMELFENTFGRRTTPEQRELGIKVLNETKVDDRIGFSDLVTACSYFNEEEAAKIEIPTLIVSGDDDNVVPVQVPLALKRVLPSASMVIIPFRGHTAVYEETDYAVKAIKDFFGYYF